MAGEDLAALLAQTLSSARVNMRALSEHAGFSYETVRSWASGRRTPGAEGVLALADALEKESERLARMAEQLREAATES